MRLSDGTQIGPYKITGPIGAGGMGEVYRARDTRLNRDVAIKVLPESFAEDAERLRRFELEAQSAGGLSHPNILTVYDIGTHDRSPYLVAELLEGESLRARLDAGKLGTAKAIDYARQIAAGLAAAHSKGITHRDIKPENLFVTRDGRVKILDFGLAKVARSGKEGATVTAVSTVGAVMGTAAYMSPEQARGQSVDSRSDIFSFGCVLYEMLTGERAFQGGTPADLMSAILTIEPETGGKMTPALARIVSHCLEKSPEERFQSTRDIAFDLEMATQQLSGSLPAVAAPALKRHLLPWVVAAVCALSCAVMAFLYFRPTPQKTFHRLTFRRGMIHAARFTPDGNGVVYSAQWESEPSEVFTARFDTPGSRALGFQGSELRSISSAGELALAQNARVLATPFASTGMLAKAPFSGGAARAVEDRIDFAEWSPEGTEMALVRETDQGMQLEFPTGTVLYRTAGYVGEPRISPDGTRIAFWDHPLPNDNAGTVAVVDRSGKKKTLTGEFQAAQGLAWAPKGDEIWFSATRSGARYDLWAVTLGGKERMVYSQSSALILQDISKDGRILMTTMSQRMKLLYRGANDSVDRELSWLDWSLLSSLSPDGKTVAFFESGEGAGTSRLAFLREASGASAVLVGSGGWPIYSQDGQFLVTRDGSVINVYPIGPGPTRHFSASGFTVNRAGLLPGNKLIWFLGNEPSQPARYYLMDLDAPKPRAVTPQGMVASPPGLVLDGKYFAGVSGGKNLLYPVAGGEAEILEGMREGERIGGWTADERALFVFPRNEIPVKVYRVERKTGRRELLREITPTDRAGLGTGINSIQLTADTKTYAYSISQDLAELHWAEGLK